MNQQNQKLYVGNLNFEANEDQVRELFGTFGAVQEVKIVMDRFTGRSRGFAFVRFDTAESAGKAKEALNGQPFQGKTLVIDLARTEQSGVGAGAGGGAGGGGYRGGERRERPAGGGMGNNNGPRGGGEFRPRREWGGGGGDNARGGDRNDRGDRGNKSDNYYNR